MSGPFVKNVVRREWDLSEYEAKAKEKARTEEEADSLKDAKARNRARAQQALVVRAPLQHRTKEMHLESRLGKRTLITSTSTLAQQGGYYCDVCECLLKDSSSYLDHINGKKHQRALGMTLRAERSSLGDVRAKLEEHKRTAQDAAESSHAELERRLQRFTDEVAREADERKAEKAVQKQQRKLDEQRMRAAEDQYDLGRITSESRKRKQKSHTDAPDADEEEIDTGASTTAPPNDDDAANPSKRPKSDVPAAATSSSSTVAPPPGDFEEEPPVAAAAAAAEDEDPEAAMMRAMGFSGFATGKNSKK